MPQLGDVAHETCQQHLDGDRCGGRVVWSRRSIPDLSAGQDFPAVESIEEWRCEQCGQVYPDNFNEEVAGGQEA